MFQDKTILKELTNLVNQLQISDSHITFREKKYAVTSENTKTSLINILYSECYALKESYQTGLIDRQGTIESGDDFVKLLSENNHSNDKVEQGWQIKSDYSNGYFEIIKQEKTKVVHASVLRNLPSGLSANVGQMVSVYIPKEDNHSQPTFYYVFSNQAINSFQNLTRIYWNITSKGAPVLVDTITKKLNQYKIPFIFKCLNHPNLYFRRDAAVLYIDNNVMHIISLILPEICHVMNDYSEEDVPLFTYQYQKGVGIAESPNSQESFGMNRIGMVAETLISNRDKKLTSDSMVKQMATDFLLKGINPSVPFLNKGSRILFN